MLFRHSKQALSGVDVSVLNLMTRFVPRPAAFPHLHEVVTQAADVVTHLLRFLEFFIQGSAVDFHVPIIRFAGWATMMPVILNNT